MPVDLFIVNTSRASHDVVIHLNYPGFCMSSRRDMGSKYAVLPVEFPLCLEFFPGTSIQQNWGKETVVLYDFVADFINRRRKGETIAFLNETHHVEAPYQMVYVCLLQRLKGNTAAATEAYKLFTQDIRTYFINDHFKSCVLPPLIRKYRHL